MLQNCTLMVLHIPKAAGTTLRWVMDRQYSQVGIHKIKSDIVGDQAKLRQMPDVSKRRLYAVFGHYCYGLHTALPSGQSFAYITILRDPVQRLLSLWTYVKIGSPDHYLHDVTQNMSFADFITSGVTRIADNGQVRQLCGADRFTQTGEDQMPYDDMVIPFGEANERHLGMAKDNLSSFACVGTTDDFDSFLKCMQQRFAWRIPAYKNLNVLREKLPVSDEELDIARNASILDYKLYEYARGLTGER